MYVHEVGFYAVFTCTLFSSDNEIGCAGMHSMLEAVQLQLQYSEFGPGLLRLSLDHNLPSKILGALPTAMVCSVQQCDVL